MTIICSICKLQQRWVRNKPSGCPACGARFVSPKRLAKLRPVETAASPPLDDAVDDPGVELDVDLDLDCQMLLAAINLVEERIGESDGSVRHQDRRQNIPGRRPRRPKWAAALGVYV
ncbi:MAG: hypothetical protein LLG01_04590 [Planctomycetaceae bacterium]|nr:hypothetical protein [Planctomycetaceae bacterium]